MVLVSQNELASQDNEKHYEIIRCYQNKLLSQNNEFVSLDENLYQNYYK